MAISLGIARRTKLKLARAIGRRRFGLVYAEPDYWIRSSLFEGSIVVDCGTGHTADFSRGLVANYGSKCFGFEPTRRHHASLDVLVAQSGGKFQYGALAISGEEGMRTFYESQDNVSGSLLDDHVNVISDATISYDVNTITLDKIPDYLHTKRIDLLKLDIEGEEYPVLRTVSVATLDKIAQLVVEFHHYCVDRYTEEDTREIVRRLEKTGFRSFTHDGKTYLFFRD